MEKYIYISDQINSRDWLQIKEKLTNSSDRDLWLDAYNKILLSRLKSRYFYPIELIIANDNKTGCGFSIMAIVSSLIEFIETLHTGKNYVFKRENELNEYEYCKSKDIFVNFLTTRGFFRELFNEELAVSFYKNVRCAILHEAKTGDSWLIHKSYNESIIVKDGNNYIIYRDNFYQKLKDYITITYKELLLSNRELKDSFIRKIDHILK